MSSNIGTGPLKMIRVEIEKPFLIGGSAQVDIFNKTSYFNFLIES